ncbi:helix-turn-helix transcriptional regulator [Clostridium sp.]|uniref:helix-turn-helix domain-containing protein n=1 Tax=Clostridium sp. TaxID=1506 RepID=UPI002A910153|nr:helix-turn-helix transcriptional regulator [Clostridium sp.]MDY6012615.1 helix-turn-helix transcriptional regulator [Clostridium sp.]
MEILSLGEKIKRKRKELNMTLKDLAKDRITPGQISLIESGRSNPSMDLLEYLALNLNTTIEYLMESEESQAKNICTYYERMAEAYILDKDFIKAEEYIEKALNYSKVYNLECKKAKMLYLKGNIHAKKGEFTLAKQSLLSANIIFIKNNKHKEIIETFLNLAKITLELKSYYSASSYLKQAEKVFIDNKISEEHLLGEIYFYLAKAYFCMENIGQAMSYASLAKERFEKINNKEKYVKELLRLSEEYDKNGDLENALKYSKKTLRIYKELVDFEDMADIENDLGKLFYDFENIEESFKHYEVAKKMRSQNNNEKLVQTLINICENYLKIKDIDKCKEVLDEINDKITDEDIEARIVCNMIMYRIYIIYGNKLDAENILLDTYRYAKNKEAFDKAGKIAIMIAKFYNDEKDYEKAEKYLDEGVNILRDFEILNIN